MSDRQPFFGAPSPDAAVFVISVAAELTGLHPQTLRTYERMGLIRPGRTGGGGRRYSARDIDLLREISDLTSAGIGIEGVRRILDLENRVAALGARNEELVAELEATREALRQAVSGRPSSPPAPACPPYAPSSRTRPSWSGAAAASYKSGECVMPCSRRLGDCTRRSADDGGCWPLPSTMPRTWSMIRLSDIPFCR